MKIALVVVLGGDLVRSTEHLGVSYIAACLREKGYTAEIIEIWSEKSNIQEEVNKIVEKKYDIVGFTTTCVNMEPILNIAKKIKEKSVCTHITLGGHMATFWDEQIIKDYPFIDSIIRGEGEITFCELAKNMQQGKEICFIEGMTVRHEEQIIRNKDRKLIDNLDELPFPVRDQFESNNHTSQYIRICSSRGCLGRCGFCSSFVGRKQRDFRWRGRSPKNVVDEIEELVRKYDFHTFDFIDSTFEDPGDEGKIRIREIAEEIIDRKLDIYYNCCFRAENWNSKDKELLEILVKSGLEKVNIGFESGNDRGLKILNKRARTHDNHTVIQLLKEFPDIYVTFGFIMFHPYSELQDLRDNADFLFGTGMGQVIRHYFWKLEVYPSTLLEKKMQKDGMIQENYHICDGMYKYNFEDDAVSKVSEICQSLLSVEEVWDFEIFDILIHTFIMRMKKKYIDNKKVRDKIMDFANCVEKTRKGMAQFNYNFFYEILEKYDNYNVSEKKKRLKTYIFQQMNYIKQMQLRLGVELMREGNEMIKSH